MTCQYCKGTGTVQDTGSRSDGMPCTFCGVNWTPKSNNKTPQEDIITKIQSMLEKARRGEVMSFAIVAQMSDGGIGTVYSLGENEDLGTVYLVTAIERMKLRILEG